jgi:flagellar hook-basal body complex protein FliE
MAIPPIPSIQPTAPATGATAPATGAQGSGSGFGAMLAGELGKLDTLQQQASVASQQLATGQATDVAGVTMTVEEASLALQLAAQVRDKAVQAYQQLFGMQV